MKRFGLDWPLPARARRTANNWIGGKGGEAGNNALLWKLQEQPRRFNGLCRRDQKKEPAALEVPK
jgi:hypothetical protein